MRKNNVLHAELSYLLSSLGHTDSIVIADAGLPIPDGVQRIDLALTAGIPSFEDVFNLVIHELLVEAVVLANEIADQNPSVHEALAKPLHGTIVNGFIESDTPVQYITHQTLKARTKQCKAVIRTGECTPFANAILYTGIDFDGGWYG